MSNSSLKEYAEFLADEGNRKAIKDGDREVIAKAFKLAKAATEEGGLDWNDTVQKFLEQQDGGDKETSRAALEEKILSSKTLKPELRAAFEEITEYRKANIEKILMKDEAVMLEYAKKTVRLATLNGSDPEKVCPDALAWLNENRKPVKTVKLCKEVEEALKEAESKGSKRDRLAEKGLQLIEKMEKMEKEIEEVNKQIEEESDKLGPVQDKLWASVNVFMGYSRAIHGYMRMNRETRELEIFGDDNE